MYNKTYDQVQVTNSAYPEQFLKEDVYSGGRRPDITHSTSLRCEYTLIIKHFHIMLMYRKLLQLL